MGLAETAMSDARKEWARKVQHATPTEHGRALGTALANLADKQEAACKAEGVPYIPERCSTCAFRHGTQANGYAATLLQAMHCVLGTDPAGFGCHHTLDETATPAALCAGYLLCRTAEWEDMKSAISEAHTSLRSLPSTESEKQ